jgi:pimeloyl-ACP methyl ester carboxylesterase
VSVWKVGLGHRKRANSRVLTAACRGLAALRCIVLSGRLDPIATHAANAALAIGLNAQHLVWEDASHALPIQHASAVNEVLRAHFAAE